MALEPRLKREQIPRGLKPARDDKNKSLSGTAEAVPFQIASARGAFSSLKGVLHPSRIHQD